MASNNSDSENVEKSVEFDEKVKGIWKEISKTEGDLNKTSEKVRGFSPLAHSSYLAHSEVDIINELKALIPRDESNISSSEPSAINRENETYSSGSESGKTGILKKSAAAEVGKNLKVVQSGGLLIVQNFHDTTEATESKGLSEITTKLIEDCHRLTEGFKEETKSVQFQLSHDESPVKDSSFMERSRDQPSSLSTNESLPWQPGSPASSVGTRMEWDSGADVGYLNFDLTKDKLDTIERLTLQGLAKQGAKPKKVVYKGRRGDRVLERIPSDLVELEERTPQLKHQGTSPHSPSEIVEPSKKQTSDSDTQTTDDIELTVQPQSAESADNVTCVTQASESLQLPTKLRPSQKPKPPIEESPPMPEMKDQSSFVNTLGDEFNLAPRTTSDLFKKPEMSARSQKIRDILEIARSFEIDEMSNTTKDVIDVEIVPREEGGSVSIEPEEPKVLEKMVQTSARSQHEKAVQAVKNTKSRTTSKSIQASGELNSLPKHLDSQKLSEMSGREVRTKSTQFFGEGANSLPRVLTHVQRIKKKDDTSIKKKEEAQKPHGKVRGKKMKRGIGSETTSTLTEQVLRSRQEVEEPSMLLKFLESQREEPPKKEMQSASTSMEPKRTVVSVSTSMERAPTPTTPNKTMVSIGVQYSPKDETHSGGGADEWLDGMESAASSQTAHSWVHRGGGGASKSPEHLTSSFEYIPGEEYEPGQMSRTSPSDQSPSEGCGTLVLEDTPPGIPTINVATLIIQGPSEVSGKSASGNECKAESEKSQSVKSEQSKGSAGVETSSRSVEEKCSAGVQTSWSDEGRCSAGVQTSRGEDDRCCAGVQTSRSEEDRCSAGVQTSRSEEDWWIAGVQAERCSAGVQTDVIDTSSIKRLLREIKKQLIPRKRGTVRSDATSDVGESELSSLGISSNDSTRHQGQKLTVNQKILSRASSTPSPLNEAAPTKGDVKEEAASAMSAISLDSNASCHSFEHNRPIEVAVTKSTQVSGRFVACDAATQMSATRQPCPYCLQLPCSCKKPESAPPSRKSSARCQLCFKTPCTCHPMSSAESSLKRQVCVDCRKTACVCPLPQKVKSRAQREEACKDCNKTVCECVNVGASPDRKACGRCKQNPCCCLPERANNGSIKMINGQAFSTYLDLELSSEEEQLLTSSSSGTKLRQAEQRSSVCSVCECKSPTHQTCVFCVCHIDKKTHIPRCGCHESVPRYLYPGFCKCHNRNLRHFNRCKCSEIDEFVSARNKCPCCEFFAGQMRAKLFLQLQKSISVDKTMEPLPPKNYFLKLEETEVSKESNDESDTTRKPLEIVTIKIPVRRGSKDKQFYFKSTAHKLNPSAADLIYKEKHSSRNSATSEGNQISSSRRSTGRTRRKKQDVDMARSSGEKEIEFLDDILKKYSGFASNSRRSGRTTTATTGRSNLSCPSLQECLESNRPDFLNAAEYRRQVIAQRARVREQRQLTLQPSTSSSDPPTTALRVFTTSQLKAQTRKTCKQLSEVTQKKEDERKKELYRTNKLMAEIFAKRLQLKTLKGELNLSNNCNLLAA